MTRAPAWIGAQAGRVVVAAVDAPLVVPNETGQRVPDRLIGRAFGGELPRATRLAERFGWVVDPRQRHGRGGDVCIAVYPTPGDGGVVRARLPARLQEGATTRGVCRASQR